MRFGLLDFGLVSGLPSEEFPEEYDPKEHATPSIDKKYFFDDFVVDCKATLADLAAQLKSSKKMTSECKLGIALILIVDDVFIAQYQIH
ncbi:hypothetical protein V5N11_012758 [Cardamine amara subsp. amara]|uniref:DUF1985 domain-containing protein n=1 Tax=Cardamine amara subsp. amara TaxID=228776 RepID=A0ABD0ZI01_CARAN